MKTNEQNKTTKLIINGLSKNKSSNSSYIKLWTASPRLLKLSLCNLKKIKCYQKTLYCNGLYFTLSPEVLCGEGNPSFIFEKKLLRGENAKEQEEIYMSLKDCLKSMQNAKKRYSSLGIENNKERNALKIQEWRLKRIVKEKCAR